MSLNRRVAARYQALASIIPCPRLIKKKKNLPGRGLTKVENTVLENAYVMVTAATIKPYDTQILQTENPADAKKYAK
jgi:hypothetical protein